IVSGIPSSNLDLQLESVTKVGQLLRSQKQSAAAKAVQAVVDSGLLPNVINMLSSSNATLVSEASWILFNVTLGTSQQTSAVVSAGAIPKLVAVFASDVEDTMHNALLALGNIAGDSDELRGVFLEQRAFRPALEILADPSKFSAKIVNTATWVMETCTAPLVVQPVIDSGLIPEIIKMLSSDDPEFLWEATWIVVNITAGSPEQTSTVVEAGVIPKLVTLFPISPDNTRHNALLCVGQIIRVSVPGTEALINAGILDTFKICITSEDVRDRKEACFAASNLVVGTLSHAKTLMDSGLVPLVIKVIVNQEEALKARGDAAWTLSSLACNWGQDHQDMLNILLEANSLEAFCTALTLKDYSAVEVSLKGILVFVKTQCDGRQRAMERFKAGDGIERLRAVRFRNDIYRTEAHKLAQTILTDHFPEFSMPARM
ncbi:hypothetical protein M407DRAFT_67217, partial [Tulasnella calospora MUT 4182]